MKPHLRPAVLLTLSALFLASATLAGEASAGPPAAKVHPVASPSFARLPLAFEANRGQTDPSVAFMARGGGSALFLRPDGAVIARSAPGQDQAVLRMGFEGAKPSPTLEGEGPLGGIVNYYRGSSPSSWIERVPCFSKVRYRNLYPGVDCAFYGNGSELEFDLAVAPGARPENIALRFRDRAGTPLCPVLEEGGGLVVTTSEGNFSLRPPRVWQERDGQRSDVCARYVLRPSGTVGIALGDYDRGRPVVIDPTMVFSTYLGGGMGEYATGVRLDTIDNPIVVGSTASADFPSTDGSSLHGSQQDVFVTKMEWDGSLPIFSTIIGGASTDMARDVAIDDNDAIYVTGQTSSSDFPVMNGYPFTSYMPSKQNGFLFRLTPGGLMTYSTLIRGSYPYSTGSEVGNCVTAVAPGKVFVGGSTTSPDFMVYGTPIQSTLHGFQDGFLWGLNTNLTGTSSLYYSTFLGGMGSETVNGVSYFLGDIGDEIFITGTTESNDFPVSQLGAFQSSLAGGTDGFFGAIQLPVGAPPQVLYMTYLGGTGMDVPERVKVRTQYVVCVVGWTMSTDFPTVSPTQASYGGGSSDAFVTFFDTTVLGPSSVIYSTYLGGSYADFAYGAGVDLGNGFYIVGTTSSTDFPIVDPIPGMGTYLGGPEDAFVTHIAYPVQKPLRAPSMAPTVYSSSFLGGSGDEWAEAVAVDTVANAVVVGGTTSTDFPTLYPYQPANAGATDVFVSSISTASLPCSTTCTATVPAIANVGTSVSFSATVTPTNCAGSPSWAWSFGDASPNSSLQSPSHTYATPGNYNWSMTVNVDGVDCTKSGTIQIVSGCGLNCSASAPTAAGVGQAVPFASSATPVGCTGTLTYLWNFGNGDTDTAANPTYTYYAGGTYNWTFTATINGVNCTRTGTISVCDLQVTASASPLVVFSGQGVSFTSTVTQNPAGCGNPLTYLWDFGDGGTSSAANPAHVYVGTPGYRETFYWTLTVTSGAGLEAYAWGTVDVDEHVPGKVYAWGSNTFGQVGDGSGANQLSPVALPSLPSAFTVAAGTNHSLAVKSDQTVWAWGKNDAGQLGDGSTTNRPTPVQVPGLTSVVGVGAGGSHSLALRNDLSVWAWGLNTSGQLGDGTVVSKSSPVHIAAMDGATSGAAGGQHTLALLEMQVYAWGDNTYGQVGDGSNTNRSTPVPISSLWTCAEAAAGDNHSLALQISDGLQTLYGWGLNNHGQIGNGTTTNANTPQPITALQSVDIEAIAAGGNHSLALTIDGDVYAWGANESGQLGDGTTNEHHAPQLVPGLSGVVGIAAGGSHSLFLKSDGTIWACGANGSGQLGHGDTTPHYSPVQVIDLWGISAGDGGGSHTLAVGVCVPLCDAQGPDSTPVGTPASFTGNVTLSTACSGTPTYDWDFGDGTAHSSQQNPTHTYTVAGSYNWTFTATINGVSCASSGTIFVCKLICGANVTAATSFPPVVANFTAASTLTGPCPGPVTYSWDFGDGSAGSTLQNPSHTYLIPGTFTWTMTASASGLTCQQTGTVTVCGVACTASASPRYGMAPLSVGFTATAASTDPACTGTPSYDWDFGDGTAHGSGPTASHTYTGLGRFTWTMTATLGGVSCTKTGTILVTACTLDCSASVSPDAGTPDTTFTFDATTTSPDCTGPVTYDWDFGDGTTHGAFKTVTHNYPAAGTYTWTLRTAQGGVTCLDTGTVYVTAIQPGALTGLVGICSESAFQPLAGSGVHLLQAFVMLNGTRTDATMSGAAFSFPTLPPGTYQLFAEMQYDDNITYANDDAQGGCGAAGVVQKPVASAGTEVVIDQGSSVFQNVCFAPPLVFLHGASSCYTVWNAWDADARSKGRISFTPNYHWWGDESSWGEKADQVYDQIRLDLAGLVGTSPARPSAPQSTPVIHWPPYYTVSHDMGGLVVRVLTSGYHQADPPIAAMAGIYLLGVPNSGSDVLLGNGSNDIMSVQAITRRFNIVYPDYGALNDFVFAIGGTHDLFGTGTSDGRVDLFSAFTIQQVACTVDGSGNPVCQPYAYLPFDSDPAEEHLFDYDHEGLVGDASKTDILEGIILPNTGYAAKPALKPQRAAKAHDPSSSDPGDPESPVGNSIWGTNGRTVGSAQGRIGASLPAEASYSKDFRIGATDGMAVYIFVTAGSGQFTLTPPAPRSALNLGVISGDYVYSELAPPQGVWTFSVTAGSGGVTFSAAFVEDSTFGIHGYASADHYDPGDTVTLRVDLQGDLTDVTVSTVRADIADPSGNPLATVNLSPIGGAGASSYAGTWVSPTGPAAAGAYKATFTVGGTYLDSEYSRQAFDTINLLPLTRVFTGAFSDLPLDRNSDGLYDAVQFRANLLVPSAGYFVMSADLYDADGNYIVTASAPANLPAGAGHLDLVFDLSEAFCVQFDRPFTVQNLRFVDAFTLNPLDVWADPIATASYASGTFKCLPGQPTPRVQAVRPDQGVQGQTLTGLQVSGSNLKAGATLAFDSGIALGAVTHVTDALLTVDAVIAPTAALGPHALTVTNPDTSSFTLPGALTVVADAPPTATILAPESGTTLQPPTAALTVTVNASDDIRVTHVDLKLDGVLVSSDSEFPFTWNLPLSSMASGAHTLVATAYDTKSQSANSPEVGFTYFKNPPTVSSVTGGGSPWQLKIVGTNFQPGVTVTIGSDATPWSNTIYKKSTKIVLKGGKTLKARFPSGQAVPLLIRNPDGSTAQTSYTRP